MQSFIRWLGRLVGFAAIGLGVIWLIEAMPDPHSPEVVRAITICQASASMDASEALNRNDSFAHDRAWAHRSACVDMNTRWNYAWAINGTVAIGAGALLLLISALVDVHEKVIEGGKPSVFELAEMIEEERRRTKAHTGQELSVAEARARVEARLRGHG